MKGDYDEWEEMGLKGWSHAGLLPYLNRLERDIDFAGESHGSAGRIPVRRLFPEEWGGFSRTALAAMQEDGLPLAPDVNGDDADGCYPVPLSNQYGRRVSTAIGYLDAATRRRRNLTIHAETLVIRILVEDGRAQGVEAVRDGETVRFDARETIVSAGALHSPALLLRAGIGPAEHLRSHGIEVVADLPGVGSNLLEHASVSVAAHLKPGARVPAGQRRHIYFGARFSSGLQGCPPGDMLLMPTNSAGWHPLGQAMGTMLLVVNKSYSRGTVRLHTPSPHDEPRVNLNMLSDERDLVRPGRRVPPPLRNHGIRRRPGSGDDVVPRRLFGRRPPADGALGGDMAEDRRGTHASGSRRAGPNAAQAQADGRPRRASPGQGRARACGLDQERRLARLARVRDLPHGPGR